MLLVVYCCVDVNLYHVPGIIYVPEIHPPINHKYSYLEYMASTAGPKYYFVINDGLFWPSACGRYLWYFSTL